MHNKLLQRRAEKRLLEAATRYFEEPDCVEKSARKLDEKLVKATLDDGRVVYVDDEDYDWNEVRHTADGRVLDDDEEYDGEITPVMTGKYSGKASALAAKNALKAKRLEIVNNANSDAFNKIVPEIEDEIKNYAQEIVDTGDFQKLTFGDIKDKQDEMYRTIVAPYCKTLGRSESIACRRAWEKYIGWVTANPADKLKPFMSKIKDQIKSSLTSHKSKAKRNESAFAKTFFKALNEKMARMYANKYDISLKEANKMFIIKNIL